MNLKAIATPFVPIAAIHAGLVQFGILDLGKLISPIVPTIVYVVGGIVGFLTLFRIWK